MEIDDALEDPVPEQPAVAAKRGRPFERGRSGNPRGRPPGSRNKATIACEALLDGEVEALTRTVIEKAKQGDLGALRLCLDRVLPPRRGRPVTFEMPKMESGGDAAEAASAILEACAAGEITPTEAAEVMGLIGNVVRALELRDIEKRLANLEQTTGDS